MHRPRTFRSLTAAAAIVLLATFAHAQTPPASSSSAPAAAPLSPILVELFTSEGCSSCPPADALLQKMNGRQIESGQIIVGLSEHVTYWNHQGWTDPFSQSAFTDRQNAYGQRFHLDSVYTPQMVINGQAQVSGGNGDAILQALHAQNHPSPVAVQIVSVNATGGRLEVSFSASGEMPKHGVDIYAVIAEDAATSSVLRGENSGHTLTHVAVARSITRIAHLKAPAPAGTAQLPTPPAPSSASLASGGRHLVLFAQEENAGKVLSVDSKPL